MTNPRRGGGWPGLGGMRPAWWALPFVCLLVSEAPAVAAPPGACRPDERSLWTCTVGKAGKIAAVCGSKDLTADQGYLQYRFGAPGRLELEFPQTREGSQEAFVYSRYTRPGTTHLALRFEKDGHTYTLFQSSSPETGSLAYVVVKSPGGRRAHLQCREQRGTLMDLEDIVPESPEWILN